MEPVDGSYDPDACWNFQSNSGIFTLWARIGVCINGDNAVNGIIAIDDWI